MISLNGKIILQYTDDQEGREGWCFGEYLGEKNTKLPSGSFFSQRNAAPISLKIRNSG